MDLNTQLKKIQLTQTQNAIWLESKLHEHKPLFIIGAYLLLSAKLNGELLKEAISNVVEKNDGLRIRIPNSNQPFQVFEEKVEFDIVEKRMESLVEARHWLEKFFKTNIKFEDGCLFEFALISIGDDKSYLSLKFHHLIMDGWARGVFFQKIANEYNALLNGYSINDSSSFSSYAIDLSHDNNTDKRTSLKFWKESFEHLEIEPLLQKKKNEFNVFPSRRFERLLGHESYSQIALNGNNSTKSRFYFVLAILFLTLARRLGKKEIVFGIPLLNRRTEEEKNTIGCFINIIPLKISYKPELTFNELVKIIKSDVRSTIPYRNVSNHEINQALGVNFSNITQLYDVLFAFEKNNYDLHFGDVTVFESGTLSNDYIQTPLVVHWFDFHEKGPVKLAWDYNLKYLSESEVVRFDDCFQAIYDHFLQSQSDSLKNAPYLNQVELAQIDVAALGEKQDFPSVGLVERIQSVVNAKPDATALVDEFGELTYKQLWANAQKAANELILKGAQDGEPVAILLPRSKDYVVSIVSILVAGAYYVPIDVDLPQERINAMLTEAGIKFVLTNKSISSRTELKHTIAIEIDRELRSKEGFLVPSRDRLDPAYCIFTSGTTGTPKGVLISSESVLNLIDSLNSHVYSHYPETTKLGLLSAFHFDASIQQIFACLILGFELNIISEQDRKDGSRLATALSNNHIEICDGVPTHISAMIGATSQGQRQFSVKHFLLGGEKLTSDLLLKFNDWLPEQNIRISNLYGPTETTVDATIHTFNIDEIQERDTISIGRPLHHINVWIVDEEGYPLPPNTEGEIVIGGKGIALGYLNQPELTAQKFKYNEVLRSLVYHSGDKGFFDQEGKFFIKGRIDNQVKIRGYRIELADIEHNLTKINGVEEALVLVHSHGEIPKLLAFVTGQKAPLGKLKEKLKRHLPDYMIPNHIYNLTAFPLNKTGKIDRSRLIDLTTIKKAGKNTDKLFLSVTERSLLDIYKEILEVDFVDVNEGFFDLGGDSLSLVFLLSRIEEVFEQELSMMQFSTQNSVREIAKFLDNGIGLTRDKISLIEFDEILEGTLQQSERIHVGHKKVALLTGATGFVGAFLLEELLGSYKQVYCLIRANDPDEAEAKLKTSVSKYALQIDFSRVSLVLGDLSVNNLGLSEQMYLYLSREIDVVYHNGAKVDFLADFDSLFAPNVLGTLDLLKLCANYKCKQLNYISTKGVFTNLNDSIAENTSLLDQLQYKDQGYKSTKWVADHLVQKARDFGIETNVFRLARMTGSSKNGIVRSDDFFHRFVIGCILLKSFPRELLDFQIDLTPVDISAKAIVELSKTQEKKNFHLINNNLISYRQIIGYCLNEGLEINLIDYDDWMKGVNLLNIKDQNNPLFPITGLLKNKGWVLRKDIAFQNEITLQMMHEREIFWPDTGSLWNSYLLNCLESFRGIVDTSIIDNTKHII